jgi:hypothetical protein
LLCKTKRDAPFLSMPRILDEVGFPATRRYSHTKAALLFVENKHIPFAGRALQRLDTIER